MRSAIGKKQNVKCAWHGHSLGVCSSGLGLAGSHVFVESDALPPARHLREVARKAFDIALELAKSKEQRRAVVVQSDE